MLDVRVSEVKAECAQHKDCQFCQYFSSKNFQTQRGMACQWMMAPSQWDVDEEEDFQGEEQ